MTRRTTLSSLRRARLDVAGRDRDDARRFLKRDDGELTEPGPRPPPREGGKRATVLAILRIEGETHGSVLLERTSVTRQYLAKMVRDGTIRQARHGTYAPAQTIDVDNDSQ